MNSKVESGELIKVLCTNSIKLSSLHYLRTSKRSSMGGRWSKCIMLPTFLRSKKKEKKRKKMMMKSSSVLLASLNSGYFEDYSILNYSNHVQSDNKDFSCALGSTVAICTCPPSKVCVPFSPSPQRNYFPMVFLTSLGKSIRSISCFDNILIIISFVRTNLSRAPDKASHI